MSSNESFSSEDFIYEDQLNKNPFHFKNWWNYLKAKQSRKRKERNLLYERALKSLPGSYKIWRAYLQDRVRQLRNKPINHPGYNRVNCIFRKCLTNLFSMPRIWIDYLEFLFSQQKITECRQIFNNSLQYLPLTLHGRIWEVMMKHYVELGPPMVTSSLFQRWIQYNPLQKEAFVDFLVSVEDWDTAAKTLVDICNDDNFVSVNGKTRHAFVLQLCTICSKHPMDIKSFNVEDVIRSGINQFSDEVGRLWCMLCNYYFGLGNFNRARDLFEEALGTVLTVRDFLTIYEAAVESIETVAKDRIMEIEEGDDLDEDEKLELNDEMELTMEQLEDIISRRPIMLNAVRLRQNPHDVNSWRERIQLHEEKGPKKQLKVAHEAVSTIDPKLAKGRLDELWIEFCCMVHRHIDFDEARKQWEQAIHVQFRNTDSLANVYVAYAECLIVQPEVEEETADGIVKVKGYKAARKLLQTALEPPPQAIVSQKGKHIRAPPRQMTVQDKVWQSHKLWELFLDLEENIYLSLAEPDIKTVIAGYDRCMSLKVSSISIILNYMNLMIEYNRYEDSFKAAEMGLQLFPKPPLATHIWVAYLLNFCKRYKHRKLERTRDLFEEALSKLPAEETHYIFLMYASFEEKYGRPRRVMAIYNRAVKELPEEEKFDMYILYAEKAELFYGAHKTRDIWQHAIDNLEVKKIPDVVLRYADMETKFGEIERARALFVYGSQYRNPDTEPKYWNEWKDFETKFGNEDSYREMLRVKRSVQVQFSRHNFGFSQMAVEGTVDQSSATIEAGLLAKTIEAEEGKEKSAMDFLEEQAAKDAVEKPKQPAKRSEPDDTSAEEPPKKMGALERFAK